MPVRSLGFRTDLALLTLGGSAIEDRGDYQVVRTPHNPTYWWGNFLLLSQLPAADDTDRWLDLFAAEFPGTAHVALGIDGVDGQVESLSAFAERGLKCEAATVMSASAVHEPPRPNRDATYRQLSSDVDWASSVELNAACNEEDEEEVGYRKFAARKVATNQALVEAGHGGWFGAFLDGELVAQLGLLSASPGLARFQWVETHPDARGRGLAGTLVHHAAQYGFDDLGAETLVMVADPDYLAVRVYRSVGFTDGETQLQVSNPPAGSDS
jgi:ribosomal protein S18 acetylase RimI-like enzyme